MQDGASNQVHVPFAQSFELLVYPAKDGIKQAVRMTLEQNEWSTAGRLECVRRLGTLK